MLGMVLLRLTQYDGDFSRLDDRSELQRERVRVVLARGSTSYLQAAGRSEFGTRRPGNGWSVDTSRTRADGDRLLKSGWIGKRIPLRSALAAALVVTLVGVTVAGCTWGGYRAIAPTTSRLTVTVSPSVVQPSPDAVDSTTFSASESTQSSSLTVRSESPSSLIAVSSAAAVTAPTELSAAELADRAAIEAQWARYWALNAELMRIPADDRERRIDEVAIDPLKTKMLAAVGKFQAEGLDYYGSVGLRPFWPVPVDGQSFALLRDCQDQSGWGSVYLSTGELRSIGVDRHFVQAGFQRGTDGVWRVQNVQWIENFQC